MPFHRKLLVKILTTRFVRCSLMPIYHFLLMMLLCLLTLNDPNKQQTHILLQIRSCKKEINILHSLIQLIHVMDGRALFHKTSFIIYTMGDKFWCILWCKSHLSCQSILIGPIYPPTSTCLLWKRLSLFWSKKLFPPLWSLHLLGSIICYINTTEIKYCYSLNLMEVHNSIHCHRAKNLYLIIMIDIHSLMFIAENKKMSAIHFNVSH